MSGEPLSRRGWLFGLGAGVGAGLGAAYSASLGPAAATLLRPPGAMGEHDFLAACTRCGQCVEACPYGTLTLADSDSGAAAGTPNFVAAEVPCWLCQGEDELQCIAACPTSALTPVADPREVRIGVAVVDEDHCWASNGIACRTCWHKCPYPNEAIHLLAKPVITDLCTGCGICEMVCPADPKAIRIKVRQEP